MKSKDSLRKSRRPDFHKEQLNNCVCLMEQEPIKTSGEKALRKYLFMLLL